MKWIEYTLRDLGKTYTGKQLEEIREAILRYTPKKKQDYILMALSEAPSTAKELTDVTGDNLHQIYGSLYWLKKTGKIKLTDKRLPRTGNRGRGPALWELA